VVTPSGHIYSKEAIYEYLLVKKEELNKARKAWEKEQAEQNKSDEKKKEAEKIKQFIETETRVSSRKRKPVDKEAKMKEFLYQPHKKGEVILEPKTKKEKIEDLKRTSFWLPQFTPAAKRQKLEKPPKRPLSPFSSKPLRMKDLVPLKLKVLDPKAKEKKFVCMVSGKEITYQDTVYIKSTGILMLKTLYTQLAEPTMICPVTSKPFKKKHVVHIKSDGSGFASTGNVIAKKWSEALMN